jgi:PKD repeat protein
VARLVEGRGRARARWAATLAGAVGLVIGLLPAMPAAPAAAQAAVVDLVVAVDAPETTTVDEAVDLDVDVANEGSLPATGDVVVRIYAFVGDAAAVTFGAPVGAGWTCAPMPDIVGRECTHAGGLAGGASLGRLTLPLTPHLGAYPQLRPYVEVFNASETAGLDFNNADQADLAIDGVADLQVRAGTDEPEFVAGETYDVRAEITNRGTVATTGTTSVALSPGEGLTVLEAGGDGWTCGDGDDGQEVCANPGAFAPDAESVIHFQVLVAAAAAPFAELTIDLERAGDPDVDLDLGGEGRPNNHAFLTVPVAGVPDVQVTRHEVAAPGLIAGEPTSITLEVTNEGTADSTGPVTLTEALDGLDATSVTGTGWSCTPGSTLTCTHAGAVTAGSALPLVTVSVEVPAPLSGHFVGLVATASAADDDSPSTRSAGSVVQPGFDLKPSIVMGTAPLPGAPWTYTVKSVNQGVVGKAGTVRITDDLGPGLSFVSGSGSGWSCSTAASRLTCDLPGPVGASTALPDIAVQVAVAAGATSPVQHTVTVNHASDTNPSNNTVVDQRSFTSTPDLTVDVTDAGASFSTGTQGGYDVRVSNVGTGATSGASTVTGSAGTGTTVDSAAGPGWSCTTTSSTYSCSRAASIAAGGSAPSVTVRVTPTASSGSQTTLGATVSGGGQSNTANDTDTEATPVVTTALDASIGATPTAGAAPLRVDFDGTGSTGPIATWTWDFGDGGAATGAEASHVYSLPGTYQATLTVSDGSANSYTTVRIVVGGAHGSEPLQADAGEDQEVSAGEDVALDASTSSPFDQIDGFDWTFGDGSDAEEGATVSHTYGEPGEYDATVTVHRGSQSATDTVHITVEEGGLDVTVLAGGAPLSGASVLVVDSDGVKHPGTTAGDGTTRIAGLDDGEATAYAYAPGYVPEAQPAAVAGGTGEITFELTAGDVGSVVLGSHEMTLEEIIDAGIDPNAPGNLHITQYEIQLTVNGSSGSAPVAINDEGELVGEQPPDCPADHVCTGGFGGFAAVGHLEPAGPGGEAPTMVWLLTARTSFLKEFFEVSMTVTSLAPGLFTFSTGSASILLPPGLSLAPTARPQARVVSLDDIAGGESASTTWIVRGDVAGDHHVEARYSAVLDPIGASVNLGARTFTPIKVWGGDALKLIVDAEDRASRNLPYRFRVGVENLSSTTVHNASVEVSSRIDGTVRQPCSTPGPFGAAAIAPGQTLWSSDYARISTVDGGIDLGDSFVKKIAGVSSKEPELRTHPPAETPETAPHASAVAAGGNVTVTWDAIPGVTSYTVWTLPEREAEFADEPAASVSGTSTVIPMPDGPSPWVAICSGGNLYHPLTPITGEALRVVASAKAGPDGTWTLDGSESEHATAFRWRVTPPGGAAPRTYTGAVVDIPVDTRGTWIAELTACDQDAPTACKTATTTFVVEVVPTGFSTRYHGDSPFSVDLVPTVGEGTPTSWDWSIHGVGTKHIDGTDGTWTADLQKSGTYDVTLTVHTDQGSGTVTRPVTVGGCDEPTVPDPGAFGRVAARWSSVLSVSTDDGLEARGVRLDGRLMATKMNLPYVNLQATGFGGIAELKADGLTGSRRRDGTTTGPMRSRLVGLEDHSGPSAIDVRATYALDWADGRLTSCLRVTQRYLFVRPFRRDQTGSTTENTWCNPTQSVGAPILPLVVDPLTPWWFPRTGSDFECGKFYPRVSYAFQGRDGDSLRSISIPQRLHLTPGTTANPEGTKASTGGLFKDCEGSAKDCFFWSTLASRFLDGYEPSPVIERSSNPVPKEFVATAVGAGRAKGEWDNYHCSPNARVEAPGFDLGSQMTLWGCPDCVHIHWRWGLGANGAPDRLLVGKGQQFTSGAPMVHSSSQRVQVASTRYSTNTEDPVLAGWRALAANGENVRRMNQVFWYVATSTAQSDVFMQHGGFFRAKS